MNEPEIIESDTGVDKTIAIFRQTFEITEGDLGRENEYDNFQRDIYLWLRVNRKLRLEEIPEEFPPDRLGKMTPPRTHSNVGSIDSSFFGSIVTEEWNALRSVFKDRSAIYKDNGAIVSRIARRWIDVEVTFQRKGRANRQRDAKVLPDSSLDRYASVLRRLVITKVSSPTRDVYQDLYDGVEKKLKEWQKFVDRPDAEIVGAGFDPMIVGALGKLIKLWEEHHPDERFFLGDA